MKLKRNAAFMSVFLTIYSTSVFAGFEWKGSAAPKSAFTNSMPAQKVVPVDQAPVPLTGSMMGASVVTKSSPVSATPLPAPKTLAAPVSLTPATVKTSAVVAQDQDEVLTGFGTNLPLSIAMHQVLPAGYTFTLSDDVNGDAIVSWKGGKSWKQVLAVMLAPQDLGYTLRGDTVSVSRFTNEKHDTVAKAEPRAVPMPLPKGVAADVPPVMDKAPMAEPSLPVPLAAAANGEGMHVAAPAAVAPKRMAPRPWVAGNGDTLRDVLTEWSRREGVTLYWALDYDYRLNGRSVYDGNFAEAVARLLDQFTDVRPQPFGQLHVGAKTPRVLVVTSYDVPH